MCACVCVFLCKIFNVYMMRFGYFFSTKLTRPKPQEIETIARLDHKSAHIYTLARFKPNNHNQIHIYTNTIHTTSFLLCNVILMSARRIFLSLSWKVISFSTTFGNIGATFVGPNNVQTGAQKPCRIHRSVFGTRPWYYITSTIYYNLPSYQAAAFYSRWNLNMLLVPVY